MTRSPRPYLPRRATPSSAARWRARVQRSRPSPPSCKGRARPSGWPRRVRSTCSRSSSWTATWSGSAARRYPGASRGRGRGCRCAAIVLSVYTEMVSGFHTTQGAVSAAFSGCSWAKYKSNLVCAVVPHRSCIFPRSVSCFSSVVSGGPTVPGQLATLLIPH